MNVKSLLNKINTLIERKKKDVGKTVEAQYQHLVPKEMTVLSNPAQAFKMAKVNSNVVNIGSPTRVQVGNKTVYKQTFMINYDNGTSIMMAFNGADSKFKQIDSIEIRDPLSFKHGITIETVDKFAIAPTLGFLNKVGSAAAKKQLHYMEGEMSGAEAAMLIANMLAALLPIIAITLYAIVVIKKIEGYIAERKATATERKIDKFLFQSQTGNEPAFNIYSDLINSVNGVIYKQYKGVLIYGPPGTSKTYIVRRCLYFAKLKPVKNYIIAKGSTINPKALYQLLYDAKDGKILILDDFDSALENKDMVNLLKAALDSYPLRVISYPEPQQSQSDKLVAQLPNKFNFQGRVIIITNLPYNKIDTAIASRIPSVHVEFDTKQVLKALNDLLQYIAPYAPMDVKKEVLQYVTYVVSHYNNAELDFRKFQLCVDARLGNPDKWKQLVVVILTH